MKRLLAGLATALLVAGCTSGTNPSPAESIPPAPAAPAGWASIGAVSASGGGVGFELALTLRRWDLALTLGEPLLAAKPDDAELKAKVGRLRQMAGEARK